MGMGVVGLWLVGLDDAASGCDLVEWFEGMF